jgi:nucleoside-diphosphate-sugar epimerase
MRALVTGGGGFLGGAIVRQLLERGDEVRSFARGEYPELTALGVDCHQGDLRSKEQVRAAVRGCDLVFHVAAKPPPWGRREDYFAVNVLGTENVVAACLSEGVQRLVYTSSPSVVGGTEDVEGADETLAYRTQWSGAEYPRSKALAEQRVLAANSPQLRTVALRPHLIWGPGDPHFLPRFLEKARRGELRRIGKRDCLVDPTYVADAAAAHLCAGDRLLEGAEVSGRAYFISSGETIGLWTMIDRLLETAGEPPLEKTVSLGLARFAANLIEGTHRLFRLRGEPRITRFVVQQVTHARWFDIGAAREKLGYQPGFSIDEGMATLMD